MLDTSEALLALIERECKKCTGQDISYSETFLVEELHSHGMLSGVVSPESWTKKAPPLLKERFSKL